MATTTPPSPTPRPRSSSAIRETSRRPLRIFPFDPMADRFREPVVSRVASERVTPGPAGRLVEVVDYDRSTDTWLAPLDLDEPDILLTQGLAPSESDYRFHQQMTYAVSMRVLEAFERGLGRPLAWDGLPRLRLLPHAFKAANAHFYPPAFALLFGYFLAHETDPGANLPGQQIFTCLSYDVIAHEICHPVMWLMRPWESDGHNWTIPDDDPDSGAFHEGIADLIALLARFSEPDVVARAVSANGNDLRGSELLQVAMQFGQAADLGAALRIFPDEPDPRRYREELEPHARGQLLTSPILQALVEVLREETTDLVRLSGGDPASAYRHPDLVRRLTTAASTLAADILRATIGALDYLPPVGVRFFDVLRALLHTDALLFGRAHHRFRSLLIEAFLQRGLIPTQAGSLAVEALALKPVERAIPRLPHAADALLHTIAALEWRRLHMAGSRRLEDIRANVIAQQAARRSRWMPAIERYATKHARLLGLAAGEPVRAHALTGANHVDSAGNLVGRVFVTLVQGGERAYPSRGVTLVCDSEGEIQFLIGAAQPTSAPAPATARRPKLTAEQRKLAAALDGIEAF